MVTVKVHALSPSFSSDQHHSQLPLTGSRCHRPATVRPNALGDGCGPPSKRRHAGVCHMLIQTGAAGVRHISGRTHLEAFTALSRMPVQHPGRPARKVTCPRFLHLRLAIVTVSSNERRSAVVLRTDQDLERTCRFLRSVWTAPIRSAPSRNPFRSPLRSSAAVSSSRTIGMSTVILTLSRPARDANGVAVRRRVIRTLGGGGGPAPAS